MTDGSATVDAQRARTRRSIVDAALCLVGERGMPGVTMSALAERAGVSRPTLYKYFPDVPHVLAAWVGEEIDRFEAHLREELAHTEGAAARVERYVRAQLDEFASHPQRFGLSHVDAGVPEEVMVAIHERAEVLRGHLERAIADGVASGEFRADVDAVLHSELVNALLGPLRPVVAQRRHDAGDLADAVLALLFDGLRGPPDPDAGAVPPG